jgi:large subunit ribosomal protein L15
MQLHNLKPKTPRKPGKHIGRGGKKGTTSGHGTKGQKGRAGASVKPGFRGGDNRLWQLFPKVRGASKKPGNGSPHRKHRFYRVHNDKPFILKISDLNNFQDGQKISPDVLTEMGMIPNHNVKVKVLDGGDLKRKLVFEKVLFSETAKDKIMKAGGQVSN